MAANYPLPLTAVPHSVQTSLAPIGYAHAGHWLRRARMRRRTNLGAAKSSQRDREGQSPILTVPGLIEACQPEAAPTATEFKQIALLKEA